MSVRKRPAPKLEAVSLIEIRCSDCGRTKRWSREHIASRALPLAADLNDLGQRLICSECRNVGGRGYNVEIKRIA